jgi:hypothetical protein
MEKVRELTKALEKALNQQRNKFQEFLNKWTTVSQEKTSEKIMNFYHDLLHFNYDVFYAYGGKGTVQVADGTALLDQVENLIDKVLDLKKQLE